MWKLQQTSLPVESLHINRTQFSLILLVVLLMPLNWYLEILKWKYAVAQEELSFSSSMQAVFSGLALNWVLPFTLGDLGGRLSGVKNYKLSGLALILIRVISIVLTLTYGGYALIVYFDLSSPYYAVIWIGAIAILIGVRRMYSIGNLPNYGLVMWLSILRYLVFTFQFAFLIWILVPSIPVAVTVIGVGWIFLFRSVIPSIFGNFGVREASAVIFFESYLETSSTILFPCLLIWFINTVIPSILGAFFIFKLRLNIAQ